MQKARKMCFDRVLPTAPFRAQRVQSYQGTRLRAISLIGKQWANGSTIAVRFMGGNQAQRSMVKDIAVEWTRHANLHFEFTDDPAAQIRVGFDSSDGAWSYVGIDNLSIPLHASTMNLGWQDEAVILHEFGHMIGLSHEHQNPSGGIQWNEQRVIQDLAGPPNFWTEEQTRHNVLNKYSIDQLHGTEFDGKSIMLYAFPAEWTVNGFATQENSKLSALDKAFIMSSAMYPGAAPPEVVATELPVTLAKAASIGSPGEVDLYKFSVTSPGTHVLQTLGTTDVFMTLLGPNSPNQKIAEDDDNGFGRNAQIVADLTPGVYFVQVRHFSPQQTGQYRVFVSR
jgi:hypothetical protein